MPNILHSPARPELDRLLDKLNRGERLNESEFTWASQWLQEIICAKENEGVTQGDKVTAGEVYIGLLRRHEREARAP